MPNPDERAPMTAEMQDLINRLPVIRPAGMIPMPKPKPTHLCQLAIDPRDPSAIIQAQDDRIAELELALGMAQSAHVDDIREIEALKDDLRGIYRLRGEDPEVARICNRALA